MLAAVVSGLLVGTTGDTGLIEWLRDLPVDFCHKLGFTRRPPKLDGFRDLLSLVVHGSGVVLAQSRVDEKANEHKGAFELLETVLLKGGVIVGDAAFCHRNLCQQIVNADGHYVLAVKENQPTGYREISLEFQAANAALTSARDDGNVGVASRLRSFMRKFKRAFAMLGLM
jgi:hypothetical protein